MRNRRDETKGITDARPHRGGSWVLPLAAGLVLTIGAPSWAQEYPPSSGELTTSTASAAPGDPVTVSGEGFAPGSTITITFESTPVVVGTAIADAAGRFSAVITIPLDATPGHHLIRATGVDRQGRPRVLTADITVVAKTSGPTGAAPTGGTTSKAASSTLTRTGFLLTLPLVILGAGLILLGAVLVAKTRRRRYERF